MRVSSFVLPNKRPNVSRSRSSKNMHRPVSPRSRRTSRMPIAPSTSINCWCQAPIRFTMRWTPILGVDLFQGDRAGLARARTRRTAGIPGPASSGMSMATRSAPQMIALATCSARAIPPEAISVTSSRMPSLTKRASWTSPQHVAPCGAGSGPGRLLPRRGCRTPGGSLPPRRGPAPTTRPATAGTAWTRIATILAGISASAPPAPPSRRGCRRSSPSAPTSRAAPPPRPASPAAGRRDRARRPLSRRMSASRTTASVPISAARPRPRPPPAPRCQCSGIRSKITGSGVSISGGGIDGQLAVGKRQVRQLAADVDAGADVLAAVDAVARGPDDFRHVGPHRIEARPAERPAVARAGDRESAPSPPGTRWRG